MNQILDFTGTLTKNMILNRTVESRLTLVIVIEKNIEKALSLKIKPEHMHLEGYSFLEKLKEIL